MIRMFNGILAAANPLSWDVGTWMVAMAVVMVASICSYWTYTQVRDHRYVKSRRKALFDSLKQAEKEAKTPGVAQACRDRLNELERDLRFCLQNSRIVHQGNWSIRRRCFADVEYGLRSVYTQIWWDIEGAKLARIAIAHSLPHLSGALTRATKKAANEGVRAPTRNRLAAVTKSLTAFRARYGKARRANWNTAKRRLDTIQERMEEVITQINVEIARAQKARREGPKLLKKLSSAPHPSAATRGDTLAA